MSYEVGDIVICRPKWPTKPAFGIWTSDVELVEKGKPAKISSVSPWNDPPSYSVQFDRDGDGTFNDCSWGPISEAEILGYAPTPTAAS